MLLNLLHSGKVHQGNICWRSMQQPGVLYHLDVSVPIASRWNNTSTRLTLSKDSVDRASSVIATPIYRGKQSLQAAVRLLRFARNDQVFTKMLPPFMILSQT